MAAMLKWILPSAGLMMAGMPVVAHAAPVAEPAPQSLPAPSPAAPAPDPDPDSVRGEGEKKEDPSPALPDAVRRMLIEALQSGNNGDVATISRYAISANPGAREEIQAMVDTHRAHAEQEQREEIEQAGLFDLWDGKIELGGFRSTGSSSEFGVNTAMSATRKGLQWTHALLINADYREANGERSQERFLASYNPTYNFDPRNFIYGLLQYERDPVVGYNYRYTGSTGIGFTLLATDRMDMAVTIGPSLREISYTDDGKETKFGGRSSFNFKWKLNPTLSLQQAASAYAEADTASITSLTALDARIISKLSARMSYNMRYESGSKLTDRAFDTTSRVTLIYDF
ncbi:MAG: hypothetical protein B7Z20_04060 [Sphingobium sp. 32-64-5]|nr:MAG: hypothetical protein B7Z20_04060 [Sphingobium sp. 32-64-5]